MLAALRKDPCSKCNKQKPIEEFGKNATLHGRKDRTTSWCRACLRVLALNQYHCDRPRQVERVKKWNNDHPERRRANNQRYRDRNRAEINARVRANRKRNPEPFRHREHSKYAKRKAAGGRGLRLSEWQAILAKYKNRCAYCGVKIDLLTKDHIVPLSRGGKHEPENIAPACNACNARKRNLLPHEWAHLLGRLL